jgi:rod shape-determining protein MreD
MVGLVAVGLLGLVVVQVAIVALLPTPVAVPDLVIVAVLALAHAHGPWVGGLAGAWAGLMLDLVPPAAGPLGGWMLVLGLVGTALGRIAATNRPGPFTSMVLLAVAVGLAVLGRAAVLWFAGTPVEVVPALVPALASAAWGLLLAPVALLLASRRAARPTAPARTVPMELGTR